MTVFFALQIFYTFNFWLMLRQQLQETQELRLLKEESLDEVKVLSCNLPSLRGGLGLAS